MTAKIAVAGVGCVCACGNCARECFENSLTGKARFALPAHRVKSTYTASYPVFLADDALVQSRPADQELSVHYFLTAAKEALAQAAIPPETLHRLRVSVIVGTSVDASFHCFDTYKNWKENHLSAKDAQTVADYLSRSTAQTISRYFGFTGPFQTVVTACASGTDAIGIGRNWIAHGLCDAVLCGGTDEINLIPYDGFIRLLIASKDRCRPFSNNRNGINIGEGAGALLLVSPEVQRREKVSPVGYVLGYGNSCDAYHPTAPDPEGKGLQRAILFALKEAGLTPRDIAFVNAHGTASQANDAAEAVAFNKVLPQVPVWGSKGVTGHTLGAAGAVEAVLTLYALQKHQLPPTIGFEEPDEKLGFSPSPGVALPQAKAALSDSLAFGGCNAALVLGAEDEHV